MARFDVEQHLQGLVGSTITTVTGRPNRVLRLDVDAVYVATDSTQASEGEPVPLADLQAAVDRLFAEGEVRVHPDEIGYRSAFVGAVLATIDGTQVRRRPARVTLATEQRRRNPPWEVDELVLALDMYLRRGLLDDKEPEVVELSRVLNSLPLTQGVAVDERYRNANGVAMKLGNFARLDPAYPGTGLSRGGRREVEVWERYADDRAELHRVADELRAIAVGQRPTPPTLPQEGEDEALEGRILFRQHRVRERDRSLARRKKEEARASGAIRFEVCGVDPLATYGEVGEAAIEVHHRVPLAVAGQRSTRLSDLALVCRNCHGAIHAGGLTRTIEEVRNMLQAAAS